MRRLFWVALGATAGILVARRVDRMARALTSQGAANRVSRAVGGISQAVREFADDVRAGMDERDVELRRALGIATDGSGPVPDGDAEAVEALLRPGRARSSL